MRDTSDEPSDVQVPTAQPAMQEKGRKRNEDPPEKLTNGASDRVARRPVLLIFLRGADPYI